MLLDPTAGAYLILVPLVGMDGGCGYIRNASNGDNLDRQKQKS